ncbi:CRISPR-associated helicase/endonuclease Cas3 [Thermoanaerobacterium sp. RBIITD]|uniref:CRISPR-associated helicase/endonuclease Cas3 n=1 Tax=Thermoanaerobacterium sp. RBIITD TaxID=1550240 RepID=UPI000BB8F749|nr:CRISPR-associated helicase/endonuclease Cas3 [Thermoanaerobacterium sp. RBIITD]SNX53627.1 CRISPR-associated helicase, Cas3 family [Thermoanaerobacterium sp. RBIITD]
MSTSYFSDLYSHPGKYLENHLTGCSKIINEFQKENDIELINRDLMSNIVLITALCHDLGKSTNYFQTYLLNESERKRLRGMKETHHSLISAVICYFIAKNDVEKYDLKEDERALLPFISYVVVKKHHGNLDDIMNEVVLEDDEIDVMKKQLDSINMDKFKVLNDNLNKIGLNAYLNKEVIYQYIDNIKDELKHIKKLLRKITKNKDISKYIYLNYLFSLLIDSDKSEVVIGDNIVRRDINLNSNLVDNYKKLLAFDENMMNTLREEAYKEVNDREIDLNKRILSINLPTGLGKTFTTISFALKLREKLYKEKGIRYRIIYSLPFLSIIEQNAQEFEKILKANGVKIDSDLLLKHHHLSDVKYTKENTEFETDQVKIMIEGWNSEIIVTTFIQFFYTIISNSNKTLRKFHRLADSIIVLDEVQSIPSQYWMLMKELLLAITNELNSYVIFVTATQPLIFKEDEIYPLIDRQKYFVKMDRVKIYPVLKSEMTLNDLCNMFDLTDGRSYLFILNTIKSAQEFYDMVKDKVPDEDIVYMSTHVLPYERLKRIKKIKEGKCSIAVTTQLVEAGVDIDFDVVIRDLAPLDSINQSAGRCNRNWGGKGEVYVVSLADEKGNRYSSHIYDKVLLNITKEILSKYETIEESEFLNIIEKYYNEVSNSISSDKARDILDAIYKLKYDCEDGTPCISKFALIEDGYYKVDAFVEINEEAKELWSRYIELKEIKNLFERRNLFDKFKADFYKYTVSIPSTIENMPADVEGFKYVNYESLKDYYDKETGFITRGIISIW